MQYFYIVLRTLTFESLTFSPTVYRYRQYLKENFKICLSCDVLAVKKFFGETSNLKVYLTAPAIVATDGEFN